MPVNPVIIKAMSAMHELWYRLSGGLLGGSMMGRPILLLTTAGRKTGRRRTTPLMYLEDGENLVVIASNGGHPQHPAWWLNLENDPHAEVQVRNRRIRVTAAEATGEDRERRIPVVILRPER